MIEIIKTFGRNSEKQVNLDLYQVVKFFSPEKIYAIIKNYDFYLNFSVYSKKMQQADRVKLI